LIIQIRETTKGGVMISPLKLERIKRGFTQIDLWMKTGIPQWRISLIERGIAPKPEEAQKIAEALNSQLDDVFPKRIECFQEEAS
jgi:transcriptional regulator with XRE-family HTH domain